MSEHTVVRLKRNGTISLKEDFRESLGLIPGDLLRITVEKTGMHMIPEAKKKMMDETAPQIKYTPDAPRL